MTVFEKLSSDVFKWVLSCCQASDQWRLSECCRYIYNMMESEGIAVETNFSKFVQKMPIWEAFDFGLPRRLCILHRSSCESKELASLIIYRSCTYMATERILCLKKDVLIGILERYGYIFAKCLVDFGCKEAFELVIGLPQCCMFRSELKEYALAVDTCGKKRLLAGEYVPFVPKWDEKSTTNVVTSRSQFSAEFGEAVRVSLELAKGISSFSVLLAAVSCGRLDIVEKCVSDGVSVYGVLYRPTVFSWDLNEAELLRVYTLLRSLMDAKSWIHDCHLEHAARRGFVSVFSFLVMNFTIRIDQFDCCAEALLMKRLFLNKAHQDILRYMLSHNAGLMKFFSSSEVSKRCCPGTFDVVLKFVGQQKPFIKTVFHDALLKNNYSLVQHIVDSRLMNLTPHIIHEYRYHNADTCYRFLMSIYRPKKFQGDATPYIKYVLDRQAFTVEDLEMIVRKFKLNLTGKRIDVNCGVFPAFEKVKYLASLGVEIGNLDHMLICYADRSEWREFDYIIFEVMNQEVRDLAIATIKARFANRPKLTQILERLGMTN